MTVEEWLGKDNKIGIDIWNKKYALPGETFEDSINRIAGGNSKIAQLIKEKRFLFGGRILANRGLHKLGEKVTYSNCYVEAPPEDNIESIFDCAKHLARTYSLGGGCGVDISKLAPRGAKVRNTAKQTSGSVSFMDLYSLTTGLIGQNGRRGALMISMSCDHPDIEEFIACKSDLNRVTKANISVRLSEKFMQAVKVDEPFTLRFARAETGEIIEKTINARELMKRIALMNWDYAEPGALFWDRITSWNLLSNTPEFQFAGTNPCAEEPLPAGGSCLLGSLNLAEFVNDPHTAKASFDFVGFDQAVKIAVDGLNEVLDEGLPLHPLEEQKESAREWRQIGLGVMGIADMLINMGIKYGDEASLDLCGQIARLMINSAATESSLLALRDGSYPKYEWRNVSESNFFAEVLTPETKQIIKQNGLRNSQLLTIAPTGSLSTMLGISGGIEPIFALSYARKTESLHSKDFSYNVEHDAGASLAEYVVTAEQLDYQDRIAMQATWQHYIDASISSTVNVPEDFTSEQTFDLYMLAWEKGLKGITIYRAGCKRDPILVSKDHRISSASKRGLQRGDIVDVSDDVVGKKRRLVSGCGTLHCTAFFDPISGDLMETYFSKGSSGGCANFMVGLSRMISLAARSGVNIHSIVDQLNSCGVCPSYAVRSATKHDTSKGSCCPIAIGNALLDMWKEMQNEITADETEDLTEVPHSSDELCPECGAELFHECGCNSCKSCGYSKCS